MLKILLNYRIIGLDLITWL